MHRALWLLLWLDFCAGLRATFRGKRLWARLGLWLLVFLFVGLIAASQVASVQLSATADENLSGTRFGAGMPFWVLLYLLATWLTAAADRGLIMRPAEIHFLVSGPFTTWEILTLNLVRLAYRAAISAGVLALVGWAYMPNIASGVIGIWLVLCVSLLVGMIASLAARNALPQAVHALRWVFSGLAVAIVVALIAQAVQSLNASDTPLSFGRLAVAAAQTPVGQWLLPPVRWMFAPLQQTDFWPVVPQQVLERLPVLAVLVLAVYALGGAFGEAATERTDKAIARRQASLRSGTSVSGRWLRNLSIPSLGRWGGIGSIAWIEMTQSLRLLPRFILYTATIVTIIVVLPLIIKGERMQGIVGLGWFAGLTAYADFLMLLQLPIGFLGPATNRLTLKQLPLPTWRVVVGTLAGPLLPLAITHLCTSGLFAYLQADQLPRVMLVSVSLVPVAFVLAATINLLGLWNIIKPRALQQRDALAAGRAMLSVWLFGLMLIPAMMLAGAGAWLAHRLWGPQFFGIVVGAATGLSLWGLALVVILAATFERWQPSAGMAGEEEHELNR